MGVELDVWIGEVADTGISVLFSDKISLEVELVDTKVGDSALDSFDCLGKVALEEEVVDLGIQRGASSKRDFVVVSRSSGIEAFSFSPPDSTTIDFRSARVSFE